MELIELKSVVKQLFVPAIISDGPFLEAYISCVSAFLRRALEDRESDAAKFYMLFEDDACPQCVNAIICLLGLRMEKDIAKHLDGVAEIYRRRMAEHCTAALLELYTKEITIECTICGGVKDHILL